MSATAAQAADTITFALTGNSSTTGTDGNFRQFTGSDGTTKVRVTGWSIDGSTVRDSYLGAYSSGLGVTSGDETGANNTHVIDNQNRIDFLLLQFDTEVEFVSGTFSTFAVNGTVKDSDATIKYGNTGIQYTDQASFSTLLNDKALANLTGLFDGTFTSLGTSAGGTRAFNFGDASGNLWLVAASFAGSEPVNCDKKGKNCSTAIDGFKFSNLTVKLTPPPPPPPTVPEPATWAMMIGGFGLAGAAMRRKRAVVAVA